MQNASALYLSCQIHRRELQQNSLIAQKHKGRVKDRATPVATVKMKVTEKEEIAGSDQIKDKEKGDKLQRAPSTTEWQQTPNPEGWQPDRQKHVRKRTAPSVVRFHQTGQCRFGTTCPFAVGSRTSAKVRQHQGNCLQVPDMEDIRAEGNLKRHKGTGPLPKKGSMVSPRHEGRLFPKCARQLDAGLNRVP